MLGPDFKAPPAPVADKWLEQSKKSVDFTASEHRDWWAVFNDSTLTRLIQLAYQQNLTPERECLASENLNASSSGWHCSPEAACSVRISRPLQRRFQ